MNDATMNMRNAASALSAAADALMEMSLNVEELQNRISYLEVRISKEENFKKQLAELLHNEGY